VKEIATEHGNLRRNLNSTGAGYTYSDAGVKGMVSDSRVANLRGPTLVPAGMLVE